MQQDGRPFRATIFQQSLGQALLGRRQFRPEPGTLLAGRRQVEIYVPYLTEEPQSMDLVIMGCQPGDQVTARVLAEIGIMTARTGRCYGDICRCTDVSLELAGYSLDIPPRPEAAERLLTSESFVEAVIRRDAFATVSALEQLSRDLPEPVVATPYLRGFLPEQTH